MRILNQEEVLKISGAGSRELLDKLLLAVVGIAMVSSGATIGGGIGRLIAKYGDGDVVAGLSIEGAAMYLGAHAGLEILYNSTLYYAIFLDSREKVVYP